MKYCNHKSSTEITSDEFYVFIKSFTRLERHSVDKVFLKFAVPVKKGYKEGEDIDISEKAIFESDLLKIYEDHLNKSKSRVLSTKKSMEIEKFKSPNKRIDYPKELHPAWEKITLSMLTYDKNARPSFEKLQVDFSKHSVEIEKDLAAKYGYESPDFDDGLKITKTLSPYQSRPGQGKQDLSKKLKEERSFNLINDLRKWLTFFRMKNDMQTKLIREFTANVYGSLKNVYKYLLMFLSTAAFLGNLKESIRQIKEKKVRTPEGEITGANIEPAHENEFNKLLSEYGSKQENSINKFKQVLDSQIIAKILGTYMTRED